MSAMARAGGGHGYFIQRGAQTADLLTSELGEGLETVAHDATLSLTLADDVQMEVLSDFDVLERKGGTARIGLGHLVSGQDLPVVIRLRFPTGRSGKSTIVRATVLDRDGVLGGAEAEASWTWASHAANDAQPRDRAVDVIVATLYAARARRDAVAWNRREHFDEARKCVEGTARKIDEYAGDCRELREIADSLRREAATFSAVMSSMALKSSHYDAAWALQARSVSGKARRSRYDAESFELSLQAGLPVFECAGRRAIIDTTSPVSFGRGPITIAGREHDLPAAFDRYTIDDIGRHIGGVDAVLGTDVLAEYQWMLGVGMRQVVFSRGELPLDGVSMRVQSVGGVPAGEIIIDGQSGVALLATSARLAYMNRATTVERPVGRDHDFHPLVGEFETDVYELEVEWAGLRFPARFGILPEALQRLLATTNAQFVVGMEVLRRCPMVFDLASGRIKVVTSAASFQMTL
jgi:hypothetical protein